MEELNINELENPMGFMGDEIVPFDLPTESPKIIKVIGVGGGGGNAVKHMFKEGIHDVTFVLSISEDPAKLPDAIKPFVI